MTKDNNLLGNFLLDGIPPGPRGQPQIEVSFDIDANGIMNISAVEKSSGKAQNITIKNDKDRLTQEQVEEMVREAEKFKEDDERVKQKLESINQFEALLYQTKASLDNKELIEKLSDEDKTTMTETVDEAEKWFDLNRDSCTKEEIDAKQEEMKTVMMPIMTKLKQSMGGGMPGEMPEGMTDPPQAATIDEVD